MVGSLRKQPSTTMRLWLNGTATLFQSVIYEFESRAPLLAESRLTHAMISSRVTVKYEVSAALYMVPSYTGYYTRLSIG